MVRRIASELRFIDERLEIINREKLPHPPHLIHRPIPKHRLAVDETLAHWAKVAAVVRQTAVIAEYKVASRRYYRLRIRPQVFVGTGHVVLFQSFAIHPHLTSVDADAVPRQSDYPLDEALRGIAGIAEHH